MKIGELSAQTGLSIDTLRYYEKVGLIPQPWRSHAGVRIYDPEILAWVGFLKILKATNMSLSQMRDYAQMRAKGAQTSPQRRIMLENQRQKVRDKIAELQDCLHLLDQKIENYHEIERRHERTLSRSFSDVGPSDLKGV